jgi:hypothetical protein
MAEVPDEEARVDAELKETERSIGELQKKRAELLRAKGAIKWAKTTANAAKTHKVADSQPVSPASTVAPSAPPTSAKALEEALKSLEWSSFKKKEGEWTFLRNRDGSLVDTLRPVTDFVDQLRKGKEVVVGRYRYAVSEDKFLNRHFQE